MKLGLCVLLTVFLTGCITSQYQSQANLETQAWERSNTRVLSECTNGRKPAELKRSEIVKVTNCIGEIGKEEVQPFVVFPELYTAARAAAVQDAANFQKGKISKEEWLANAEARGAAYIAEVNRRISLDEAARQQAFAQAMQQASANMQQQQYQQQQLLNQQMLMHSLNRPTTTNCHRFGNNVNCTTY